MKVLSLTLTSKGQEMARRLPWETAHGALGATVRERWGDVEAFVLFAAVGIGVRVIGPLLADKTTDPAVVCVDEAGRWVVALSGGHAGGANELAREVAALLEAEPVITTATDAVSLPGLDAFAASGDVASVTRALLDGDAVWLDNPREWPIPPSLAALVVPGRRVGPGIVVSDSSSEADRASVTLHPPSLVLGVGASRNAPTDDLAGLAALALAESGLSPLSVGAIATLDRKLDEPAILALAAAWHVPLRGFAAEELESVCVPNPSETVSRAVGTPSVAEAAALMAAGGNATLVVEKRASTTATVAIARRSRPAGHLAVVGLGPGGAQHRTPAATAALRHAEVVIGYGPYVDQAADVISPATTIVRSPIGDEVIRACDALETAAGGRRVALVCSGDAGVYALATLVFERAADHPALDPVADVEVIPGVTAATAAAAALGAPLGHDHANISLSDLLTPWDVIEKRLRAAAESDLVVSLYNPRSVKRDWQLGAAREIFLLHRSAATPVGIVTNATRSGQRVVMTTLGDLDPTLVGMTTCVTIGASTTRIVRGRMVTPRGYR